MSKMSELSVLLGEIINTGSSLLKALTAVRELVASLEDKDLKVIDVPEQKAIEAPKPAAKAKAKKEEPTYTLETVREVLSRKSNIDGGQHRAEVKALVKKYGKYIPVFTVELPSIFMLSTATVTRVSHVVLTISRRFVTVSLLVASLVQRMTLLPKKRTISLTNM